MSEPQFSPEAGKDRELSEAEILESVEYAQFSEEFYSDIFQKCLENDPQSLENFKKKMLAHDSSVRMLSIAMFVVKQIESQTFIETLVSRAIPGRIEKEGEKFYAEAKRNYALFASKNRSLFIDYAELDNCTDEFLDITNPENRNERLNKYIRGAACAQLLSILASKKSPGFEVIKYAIEHVYDEVPKENLTAGKIEESFEVDENEQWFLPSRIPRVGGIINLPVVVDNEGKIHTRKYMVARPGKQPEQLRFRVDGIPVGDDVRGEMNLSFRVVSNKGGEMELAAPEPLFQERGAVTRPVGYVREAGLYILSDGRYFAIPQRAATYINIENGFSKSSDGMTTSQFPVVEIFGEYNPQKFEGLENSVERKEGYSFLYFGNVLSAEEFKKRKVLEDVFAQYYRQTSLTDLDREPFKLVSSPADRKDAAKKIREASQEKPLEVVVSAATAALRLGFENFLKELKAVKAKHADASLDNLEELALDAQKALLQFENQSKQTTEEKNKLRDPSFWDSYITFFRAIDNTKLKELFDLPDIRRRFFVSDLDGETAIEFFSMAQIRTRVIPFAPDQKRQNRPYIHSAIHLDISHGFGTQFVESEGMKTIFLDEDRVNTFSSAHAVIDHLYSLNLFENNRLAQYLSDYIDELDGFVGLFESQKGCEAVIENHFKNIYGLGGDFIGRGNYDLVLQFFKKVLPELEEQVLRENPGLARKYKNGQVSGFEDERVLRRLVLRKLVTFDARPFFKEKVGDDVDRLSNDISGKIERSDEMVRRLRANGFACQSIFGKTLFDPFNSVDHRSLAAFAAGFDCYVGYNQKENVAVINLSPFQDPRSPLHEIPTDLFLSDSDEPYGLVIKGGRYFVMNSSMRRFRDFKQIVDRLVPEKKYSRPAGLQERITIDEKARNKSNYRAATSLSQMRRNISPGWVLNKERRPQEAPGAARVTIPESFALAQKLIREKISEFAADPLLRFADGAADKRKEIAEGYVKLKSSADFEQKDELVRVAYAAIVEDARETLMAGARAVIDDEFEMSFAPQERARAQTMLLDLIIHDSGLDNYMPHISTQEREELLSQWRSNV